MVNIILTIVRQLKISGEKITHRTSNINRYFTDVEKTPLLSADDEFEVSKLAQLGDENAIQRLISANLRFVVSVAKQYTNAYIPLEELISQGNIGLCDAARSFDPTRGFKFISYAVWHIRKEILYYLNTDSRVVRLPQNIITDLARIKRIDERILQEEGRAGTFEEIHDELIKIGKETSIDNIKRIVYADTKSIPLESNDPDESFAPVDWISSGLTASELVDEDDMQTTAMVALSKLNSVQRDIVSRRLGITCGVPETFSTISETYDKTPEWARQLFTRSLKIMRAKLNRSKLTHDRVLNSEV